MKRSKQQLLGSLAAALLATAGLVSCSQEDGTDLSGGQLLEGKYPLVLTASVEGMTTRTDGKDAWAGNEEIGVRMVVGETTAEAKYVIVDEAGIVVQPATVDDSLFWLSPASATITSWYPYEAQTDVDISDQSSLTDFSSIDFLTATEVDKPYGNTVELKFRHQMAKVSYTLAAGDGFTADDLADAIVLFAGYTTASFSKGVLTGETDGWITPTSNKDVLLVPQNMTDKQFIKVSVNGSSYVFTPTDANLQAGYHYTYNITVSASGLSIETSTSVDWGTGASESGTVYIGDGYTYTEVSGTRSYTVTTEDGLLAWAEYASSNLSTNCTLANDITLSTVQEGASNWTAVGDNSNQYTGTFDGNGYTITNLTINASSEYQGLIGYLGSGGEVKDLTLTDVSITSSNYYVGAVVGSNYNGSVTDCYSTGTVTSTNGYIGGVVGYNVGGTVTACYASCTVSGSSATGGVVGGNSGSVTACYATGTVTGSSNTGGVVGSSNGTVTACYATGTVSGNTNTGGVLGFNNTSTGGNITTCYWTNSSSDTGAATTGIGSPSSNDGATKVEDDVTWTTAKDAMNSALTGSGWQYTGDGSTTPPLTLVAE